MSSDLLALLDDLDRLHGAATEGEWFVATGCSWRRILIVGPDSPVVVPTIERDGHPDLHATMPTLESIVALHNAYPRLAQALRTALTPTTDGEREAREALARYDSDPYHGDPQEQDIDVDHLRTALALLATERAKVADAARERDELRAQLTALRSVPDGVIRNVGDGRAVFSITLTTPPPHIGPDPVDVAARTRTLTPKVTP